MPIPLLEVDATSDVRPFSSVGHDVEVDVDAEAVVRSDEDVATSLL